MIFLRWQASMTLFSVSDHGRSWANLVPGFSVVHTSPGRVVLSSGSLEAWSWRPKFKPRLQRGTWHSRISKNMSRAGWLIFLSLWSFVQYNSDKAIVDSGTTLLRLPGNVFSAVVEAIMQTSLVRQIIYLRNKLFAYNQSVLKRNWLQSCFSCSPRLRISQLDSLTALSLHVGWEENHHWGFFPNSQSTSEQRTPASPSASPSSHRSGLEQWFPNFFSFVEKNLSNAIIL